MANPSTLPSGTIQNMEGLVGGSQPMLEVFQQISRAGGADCTVLVTGESGTGKELAAQALHRRSRRREGPLVTINMAAVPETLMDSEMFGHCQGAFTGAVAQRMGRFEAAQGGTLFIDEIGDLPLTSQAKLLRVLETHRVTPVGSNEEKEVDVRVVAATSRNVEKMLSQGEFREDLYYRLNVVRLTLPPLRQRREDIPLLVQYFLEQLARTQQRPPLQTDPALMCFLESYPWPGNVRQLRNCLESMVVLARSATLTTDDLPAALRAAPRQHPRLEIPPGQTLAALEKAAILTTLHRYGGNRTRTANELGIAVRTLQRKLTA